MLPVTWTTVRLFLHVLAAMVWVGGQLTLLGLLPTVRTLGPDAPTAVARRFAVVRSIRAGENAVVPASWNSYFAAPETPPHVNTGRLSTTAPSTGAPRAGADRDPYPGAAATAATATTAHGTINERRCRTRPGICGAPSGAVKRA